MEWSCRYAFCCACCLHHSNCWVPRYGSGRWAWWASVRATPAMACQLLWLSTCLEAAYWVWCSHQMQCCNLYALYSYMQAMDVTSYCVGWIAVYMMGQWWCHGCSMSGCWATMCCGSAEGDGADGAVWHNGWWLLALLGIKAHGGDGVGVVTWGC